MKTEHAIHLVLVGTLAACGKRAASGDSAHAKFASRDPRMVTCKPCAKYAQKITAFAQAMPR